MGEFADMGVDTRRRDPQGEIGPRRAQAQPVGVLWAACVLCVPQVHVIGAVGGQGELDQRIGLVRVQPIPFVVVIVIQ